MKKSQILKDFSISQKRVVFFQECILVWYKNHGRKFYWRQKKMSNYQYIITEILLQRTKAETVSKFYPQFITVYPNWKTIADSDVEKIEELIKPIGLYRQRSRKLILLAKEMVKRNQRLPKSREELESIPMMGQYISNAVELLIFKKPVPLVDVNMSRVLERFFGKRKLSDIRYDPYLQNLAYRVVNHARAKEINWGILDFAAIQCKPKPICSSCELKKGCKYFLSKD